MEDILKLAGLVVISILFIAFLCRVLTIPWNAIAKSIPKETKTKKGYVSLVGFALMLIFLASLFSNPQFINIALNVVFNKYVSLSGNNITVDLNEAIWAAVVLFLGNLVVIAFISPDGD